MIRLDHFHYNHLVLTLISCLQGFADPMNNNKPFTYPVNTGISYSFTDTGYFEEAQYRFLGNGQYFR